jgi:hypothetical protein
VIGTSARAWWTAARQPLLLAVVMGCVVSLAASGRVAARLVLDGALSSAFVPAIEAGAFALVYRRSTRALPFAAALDRFFRTNAPWLFTMTALAALTIAQTPRQTGLWIMPPRVWIVEAAAAVAIGWSVWLDVAFFRTALGRPREAAIGDALVFRAFAWTLGTAYFFGYAAWPLLIEWTRR